MEVNALPAVRDQIIDRRQKLDAAVASLGPRTELVQLIAEVDAALQRLDLGTYGACETCHEPIEPDRLMADPLVRFCLDHLSPAEQRALERDLELAARIQHGLLPDAALDTGAWDVSYAYQPARVVSGDYCDIIPAESALYFVLGDVSGKGVPASMLMAHLHAMVRTLISVGLPLDQLVERASRVFCESTLPSHYATLVCGRADAGGGVEICNAGHLPVIVDREQGATLLNSTSVPVGMFCAGSFPVQSFRLERGELIVLCSDGVTDAEDASGVPYGIERLTTVVREHRAGSPEVIVDACIRDLATWRAGRQQDDVTLLVLRRSR